MTAVVWVVEHIEHVAAGLLVWTAVAVVVALLLGAAIRRAEKGERRG